MDIAQALPGIPLGDDEEQRLTQVRLLTDYIGRKQAELKAWNEAQGNVAAMSANRRRMTNIGTFRAYALAYLKSHPDIQPNMTCMVRQMQTTAQVDKQPSPEQWVATAAHRQGSWWEAWSGWMQSHGSGEMVDARQPPVEPALGAAPGRYVMLRHGD